ncbi:Hypothetical_protein [Hexamita inflata]|uniref:Hypothetical_protein n=1 Tax=Hexamita inflata TaxID=28002 RepID=A0AA86QUB6_9EUKA|nr:Hypothetical protein HINF_LOCUS47139 [Hexamita inflata]
MTEVVIMPTRPFSAGNYSKLIRSISRPRSAERGHMQFMIKKQFNELIEKERLRGLQFENNLNMNFKQKQQLKSQYLYERQLSSKQKESQRQSRTKMVRQLQMREDDQNFEKLLKLQRESEQKAQKAKQSLNQKQLELKKQCQKQELQSKQIRAFKARSDEQFQLQTAQKLDEKLKRAQEIVKSIKTEKQIPTKMGFSQIGNKLMNLKDIQSDNLMLSPYRNKWQELKLKPKNEDEENIFNQLQGIGEIAKAVRKGFVVPSQTEVREQNKIFAKQEKSKANQVYMMAKYEKEIRSANPHK